MDISKELFEAVIGDNVKYYSVNIDEIEYDYVSLDRNNPLVMDVNDFYFRCMKWALENGYNILCGYDDNGNVQAYINLKLGKQFVGDGRSGSFYKYDMEICYWGADSVQQAMFEACKWILERK